MRYFFYGTLMDRDVLALVLDRPVAAAALKPARLRGWRRTAIEDASYPIVVRQRSGLVEGASLDRVSGGEAERLATYEGPRYSLVRAFAEFPGSAVRAVFVFVPRPGSFRALDTEWSLAGWQAAHKQAFMARLVQFQLAARADKG